MGTLEVTPVVVTVTTMPTPTPTPTASAHRLHKRRQRARNQEKRQLTIDELLDRLPPVHELPLAGGDASSAAANFGSSEAPPAVAASASAVKAAATTTTTPTTIGEMFGPIPALSAVDREAFWSSVPAICDPRRAVLKGHMGGEKELASERYHDDKFRRKQGHRSDRGELTRGGADDLYGRHGRRTVPSGPSGPPADAGTSTGTRTATTTPAATDAPPTESTPYVSLLSNDRGQRKAWQVENFVSLLQERLRRPSSPLTAAEGEMAFSPNEGVRTGDAEDGSDPNAPSGPDYSATVVDFGCGSGNLCLALAAYFPNVLFVLVDKKPYPLELAQRRADEANLTNVRVVQYEFSPSNLDDFELPPPSTSSVADGRGGPTKKPRRALSHHQHKRRTFDVGIGLHCCGSFTDMVMALSRKAGADCVVCPCCNGAMTAGATTGGYSYPRSTLLRRLLTEQEYLERLSRAADDLGNRPAKCVIEYDRALWASENGYAGVRLFTMTPPECTPKHHVLYLTDCRDNGDDTLGSAVTRAIDDDMTQH